MQRSGRPTHDIFVLKTKIFWYVVTLQCHYVCSDLNCINEIEIVEILDKKNSSQRLYSLFSQGVDFWVHIRISDFWNLDF